jgi:hypothetical protein
MAELFTVSVALEGPANTRLHFHNKGAALAVYAQLVAKDRGENDFEIEVEDDYGTRLMINRDKVALIAFEDPKRIGEAQIEAGLIQARTQAKANKLAADDASLKLLNPAMGPQHMFRG